MSDSTSPRKRLSLYLSAQLMYGTILVHDYQIKTLFNQARLFIITIKRPTYKFQRDDEKSKEPKKRRQVKPKEPKEKELQNLSLEEFEQQLLQTLQGANVIDPIHITLPEEMPTTTTLVSKDQDLFGDEDQIDRQLEQLAGPAWAGFPAPIPDPVSVPVPAIPDQSIPHVADVTPTALEKRPISVVADVEESPSKRRKEADATKLTNAEMLENIQRPVQTVRPRRPAIPRRKLFDNIVESPSQWKRGRIDRSSGRLPALNGDNSTSHQQDAKDLIAAILASVSYTNDDLISVVRDVRENLSIESGVGVLAAVSELQIQTLEPVSEHIVPAEILEPQPQPQLESVLLVSPRLSRIEIPTELKESYEIEAAMPSRIHTSTPIMFETEAHRHEHLIAQLRCLFDDNDNQPLRLEDLCRPLNRLNVARTFHDLLSLQAQMFVTMSSQPGSNELQYINRGKRL